MEELDAVRESSAAGLDVRERSEDGGALGERDAEGAETSEEGEAEETDPCVLGTCSCKVTYVATGKPVPRDAFAMSIRDKYE